MKQSEFKATAKLPTSENQGSGWSEPGEHEYSFYLNEQGISYAANTPYLVCGSFTGLDGWLIHISVVPQHFHSRIRQIVEFLKSSDLPFAIPTDARQHLDILNGNAGFQMTGKVISIGVSAASKLQSIVADLSGLTANAVGPAMPYAYHLTDAIAVSHGSLTDDRFTGQLQRRTFYGSAIANHLIEKLKSTGETWPFKDFRPLKSYKESRLLNKQYIPVGTFKKEPKGNVIKALKLNRIFNFQWCVLKQGRRYQSLDHYGRDAKDRLHWQYRIHQRFESYGILPRPLDLFELNGDTFFAMEYKESVTLTEKPAQLAEGHSWRSVPSDRKRTLTGYLLQVAGILNMFHAEGILHRDLTPSNFIVTEAGQLFAIDIELCYDLRNPVPDPPFTLGTPGYMSPAQAAGSAPSIADDIYSFGALMVSVITGILPNRLNQRNAESIASDLAWFIESPAMTSLIVSCIDQDPALRPSLDNIRHVLELYDTILMTSREITFEVPSNLSPRLTANLLTQGFKTLSSMISQAGNPELMTLILFKSHFPEAGDGLAHSAIDNWLNAPDTIEPPEYDLLLLATERSKLNDNSIHLLSRMSKAGPTTDTSPENSRLSVSGGLSGRGLKLLALTGQNLIQQAPHELTGIVDRITGIQCKDGSWTATPGTLDANRYKVTGFSHGVAGITYFLLACYAQNRSADLAVRITAALDWLKKQRKLDDQKLIWTVSVENKMVDPWLEHGFSGVALTFIKAYEVLGNIEYKNIASEVLAYHPMYITSNNCSFGNGLAGLGEVYLEAFRIFGDQIWCDRARAIQGVLLNSCYRDHDQCYWLDGTQLEPIADFWSGNAGILHFLLRITRPDEVHFPTHLIS